MKLTIVVRDNYPDDGQQEGLIPFVECAISGCEDDIKDIATGAETVRSGFIQAEQVARLTEVSGIIRKEINAYYSKDENLLPKVHNVF